MRHVSVFVGKLTPGVVSRRDTAVSVSGLKSSNRYGKIKKGGSFLTLFVFICMLNRIIRKVLFEEISLLESKDKRGYVLFSKVVDKMLVRLISSKHQRNDRFGNLSYEDSVEKYENFLEKRKSKFQVPPRIGVPDKMIADVFSQNVNKIDDKFKELNKNKIIFVKKRKNNEDDPNFDYIEIILDKDGSNYTIISSAFSEDGKFLKNYKTSKQEERVMLEIYDISRLPIVFL